ncbi:hypothetical protein GXY_14677 [Novacetimonas hansenii ATCC 23769]|uniref:Uncharacterized protein n=1 Tax=Novacetimonas hansenii ATCC 23769 TaxID=714995 RepID=D5QIF4_NOVHA|nr:hypothetical protein GXY_14677 [Novacetimonas hansenii ATCC 23769]
MFLTFKAFWKKLYQKLLLFQGAWCKISNSLEDQGIDFHL